MPAPHQFTYVRFCILMLTLLLAAPAVRSQPYFQKTYGGSGAETGAVVNLTSDGGFIIGGTTGSFGSGANDAYLVKLNASGDTMWTKAVGTGGSETIYGVEQTNDNGYILAGTNGSLYLNKVDAGGASVWAKSYGGGSSDEGRCVQQTPDNGYITAGFTSSYGAGAIDVLVVKTNATGDTMWTRTFGGPFNDRGYSLDQTSDGGYVICGQTNSFGAGNSDVYLIKVNAAGALQWSKTYGGGANEEGLSVAETSDQGFIITGYSSSFSSGGEDIYALKTDALGVVQWSFSYGLADGNDRGNSIVQTAGGQYALTGSTNSNGSTTYVAILLKLTASGSLAWPLPEMKVYGGNGGNEAGYSIRQAADGGYVLAGNTQSFGAGSTDIFLVKTDSLGEGSNSCGSGGFSPVASGAATIESPAATLSGSGTGMASPSAVAVGTATAATKLPLGVLITTTSVSCYGDMDGQAVANASAGTPPYTYSWSVGSSTTSVNTGLPPGIHALSVIDAFGCVQTDSFKISEPAELSVSFTVDTIAGCGGGANGVITGSVTGGTLPYNFNWSNGSSLISTYDTSHTVNGLAAGTYNLTVTDANGCSAVDTIRSGMTFTAGGNDANCSTANGSAWVSVTGGNTPYTYLWNDPSAQTTDTATGLTPGVYAVFVTDSNGCTDSSAVTVNSLFGGPELTIDSVAGVSCFGANDGAVYLTVADGPFGLPPYSILWSNGATTEDISGLSGGAYSVEVTETSTGCVSSALATVTQPSSAVTATITDSTDISCNAAGDGSAAVSGNGGTAPFTYSWSPSGGNGPVASNLAAGVYTAAISDANGCTASASVTLSEPAALLLITDTVGESCTGGDGKAWVTASGGTGSFAYLWSDPGAQATDTAFNLTSGTYTVTVTDNNGCSNTASAVIVQNGNPPVITLDLTNDVTCNGGADGAIFITVTGGTGSYTYSWSPGLQTTQDITGLSAGTHAVTVIDNSGCAATGVFTIYEPNPLGIVLTGTNISCNGSADGTATVSASDGTGPYAYLWSTGATASTESGLGSGFAAVTVTDNCSAVAIDSVNIIEPGGIAIGSELVTDVSCNGAGDGGIAVSASGGSNPLAYSINGGSTFPNTTGIFTGLSPGNYDVAVQDSNGCQVTGSTLTVNEPPALSIDSETASDVVGCAGSQTGGILLTASGGTGAIVYSIDSGVTYQAAGSFTGLSAGTYVVMVSDSVGCTLQGSTLAVLEPAGVVISSEVMTGITCAGAADGSITVVATGGAGALAYSVDGGGSFTNSTGIFTGLSAGIYDIVVRDTVPCPVTGSTFTITDPPAIAISSETATDVTCFGDADGTITITASGGTPPLSYSSDGGTSYPNTTGLFTGLSTGAYTLYVQDSNACTISGSTLTISGPGSAITVSDSVVDVTGCSGNANGAIYLSGTGGTGSLVYSIDGGISFDSGTGVFTNLSGGSYDPAAQDDNGCIATGGPIFLSQPSELVIVLQSQADPTKGNCNGSISILPMGGTPGYTYLWDDAANQTNATATNLCGGAYLIRVTDANGCEDTLTITLTAPDNDLFIPTAFSPNGDHENDRFLVRGSLASMTMLIYDRWGEKVFESNDQGKGWDGIRNGRDALSDSYGYYIEVQMPDGSTRIFKGDVLLVR